MSNKKLKNKTQSIGYEGKVTIQLRKGKKIIGKKILHNEGNLPLFQFLASCVKGSYSNVESLRPKFIKIFTIGNAEDELPLYDSFNELVNKETTNLISLNFPLYSSEPKIVDDAPNNKSSVTFKFIIPFTQLSQYENLNMIALYSQYYFNTDENASAYIIITKMSGENEVLGDIIEEIGLTSITNADANLYNLFIEWTMSFKNEGE